MFKEERDLQCLSPAQAVQKADLRQTLDSKDKDNFRLSLSLLLQNFNPSDREWANKGCAKTFLESTFRDA